MNVREKLMAQIAARKAERLAPPPSPQPPKKKPPPPPAPLFPQTPADQVCRELEIAGGWLLPGALLGRCPLITDTGELQTLLAQLVLEGRVAVDTDRPQPLYRSARVEVAKVPEVAREPNYFNRNNRMSATSPRAIPSAESVRKHNPWRADQRPPVVTVRPAPSPAPAPAAPRTPAAIPAPSAPPVPPHIPSEESSVKEPREQILKHLAKGPMKIGELAEAIDLTGATVRYHLDALAKDHKVTQVTPGNRQSPWQLKANGASPPAAAAPARNGATSIGDLDLKLSTLDAHIKFARESERAIHAFILTEIRKDLERIAA